MKKILIALIISTIIVSIFPLSGLLKADTNKIIDTTKIVATNEAMIDTINQNVIHFDHASVGENTLSGLSTITYNSKQVILEDHNRGNPSANEKVNIWKDELVARNTDGSPADDIDIAVFKWCFIDGWDVYNSSTPDNLAGLTTAIAEIRTNPNPRVSNVKILIFTIPLESTQSNEKIIANNRIKALTDTYTNLWVYDIADFESRLANNSQCLDNGTPVLCSPDYTYDGGHPGTPEGEARVGLGFFLALYQVASDGAIDPSPTPTPTPTPTPIVGNQVYRFWSGAFHHHFYTANETEKNDVINNYDDNIWRYEGSVYAAVSPSSYGAVPLYRFWSGAFHGHFYTANETEKNDVINNYDDNTWHYEGIAYYVYNYPAPGTTPVYRFWSGAFHGHFYTANETEKNDVINNYDDNTWHYEGIAYYVIP